MPKYGSCLTFDDFCRAVQANKHSVRATEKIDYLLLEGGKIKSYVHKKIKEDSNIKGYGSPGQFFRGIGDDRYPQQRSFFGHIAHLIVDEGCVLKFGEMNLDRSISNEMMGDIISAYENDEYIQIIGFRSDIKENIKLPSNENTNNFFVPTKSFIEDLVKEIDKEGKGVTEELLFSSIEIEFSKNGKKLKSDWKNKVRNYYK